MKQKDEGFCLVKISLLDIFPDIEYFIVHHGTTRYTKITDGRGQGTSYFSIRL